ncbi:hypothetical protein CEXT_565551 [Caerostris extrusa]|uniref:Uncharacterized protein n=1 Tax=Caerostris extrusa TaxID=172846 RepID=A0AAV4MSX3_CAEEX|nr:hypothetical protein CEXT_565551 [Caerostris extrusa]
MKLKDPRLSSENEKPFLFRNNQSATPATSSSPFPKKMQISNQIRKRISAEKWRAFVRRINVTSMLRFMRVLFSGLFGTHGEAAVMSQGKNPRRFF